MRKKDIAGGIVIGLGSALLFLVNFYYLGLGTEFENKYGRNAFQVIAQILQIFPVVLPALALVGLWIVDKTREKLLVLYQAGKNILVGILNTLVDLTVLNFLLALFSVTSGVLFSLFKAISFCVATFHSYVWNKYWTFEKTETSVETKEVSGFYLVAIGGLVINVALSSFLVNIVGPQFGIPSQLWANLSVIFATVGNFVWNFTGYKLIIFKK